MKEALLLWEERERIRAEILAAVDEADASLTCGDGRAVTQASTRELADAVKQRGRARLTGEQYRRICNPLQAGSLRYFRASKRTSTSVFTLTGWPRWTGGW